nr:hypothetical protein [Tanacetum cinerariifolium]
KKTNDVVRLQDLIDRKKVIITKDIVRQALRLNDAESIDCLPTDEIFTELARMGNVDSVPVADAEPTSPSPTPTTTPPPPQQEVTSTLPLSPHQSPQQKPSSPPQQPQPSQTTTKIFYGSF